MARRTVVANARAYTVVDDFTSVYRVLIYGSLRVEPGGRLLDLPFTASADVRGAQVKALDGGFFCIAGREDQVFPAHATQAYTVNLSVQAGGYFDAATAINVPAAAPYPVVAPILWMQARPVVLSGRVTADTSTRPPVAGAAVTAASSAVEHALALAAPLAHDFAAGATVAPVPPGGAVSFLARDVRAGDSELLLSSPLAAATVRVSDGANADQRAVSAAIERYALLLRTPLAHDFAAGATVTPVPPGTARQLSRGARAGDGLIVLDGPLAAGEVQVADGTHTDQRFVGALSDAGGYYQVQGVGRVAALKLQCTGIGKTANADLVVNFTQAVNRLDFVL